MVDFFLFFSRIEHSLISKQLVLLVEAILLRIRLVELDKDLLNVAVLQD